MKMESPKLAVSIFCQNSQQVNFICHKISISIISVVKPNSNEMKITMPDVAIVNPVLPIVFMWN